MRRFSLLTLVLLLTGSVAFGQAQRHLGTIQKDFGLTPGDISGAVVTDSYTGNFGIKHTYFQQTHAGIGVFNGLANIHELRGQLHHYGSRFVPNLASKVNSTSPSLSAEAAVARAAQLKGLSPQGLTRVETRGGASQEVVFNGAGISLENIPAKLVYQPMPNGSVRLAWDVGIYALDAQNWWQMRIDASNGSLLDENNWVVHDTFAPPETGAAPFDKQSVSYPLATATPVAPQPQTLVYQPDSYNTWPPPVEAPHNVSDPGDGSTRTTETNPAHPTASPFGWHDNNTTTFTTTQGNNTHSYGDLISDNVPDPGSMPSSPTNDYNLPLDFTMAPSTYTQAAVANLFYWNNVVHDWAFLKGWDTAAGTAQDDNNGGGGAGGDHMLTEAQDGGGNCNANQSTPPDGGSPRQQMYTCSNTSPSRDGDFDHGVVAHEHGHSWSIRQTGGPGNSGCLNNSEQMGEGWSDYIALLMTIEPGDAGADSRGIGTWLFGQGPGGPGIRPTPYSTNMAVNGTTYGDIGGLGIPHGVGYAWATMIWDMTWELINQFPVNPDIFANSGGNNIAAQIVNSGLQLQPCNPGFVDGRDAIMSAIDAFNTANDPDIDKCAVWQVFADRGLGASADQGSPGSSTDGTEAFDLPPLCLMTLKIETTAAPDPVEAGANLTISFTVTNDTPGALSGVVVTNPLPTPALAGTAVTYVSDTCGGADVAGTWTWNIGGMAAAAVETCDLVVQLPATPFSSIDFMDDMETTANWATSGPGDTWTNTAGGTGPDGGTQPPSPGSGGNRWFGQDVAVVTDQYLDMNLDVNANGSLQILHAYDLESTFDGGVIEVSTDGGGSWNDITAVGGVINTNGYNATISGSFGSPIGGRMAFTGSSGGWITTEIDVSGVSLASVPMRLRFRLATDTSVDTNGWWVDDISFGTQVRLCNTASVTDGGGGNTDTSDLTPCPLVTGPLPVELTSFEGFVVDGGGVVLEWATASETNNAGFSVEQKGITGEFTEIAFVEGHGTTTQAQHYSYQVDDAGMGRQVFRLKQVDFDGTFEYSNAVEVVTAIPKGFELSENYPNPFNPSTNFNLIIAREQQVAIKVYDMQGRQVRSLFDGALTANDQHQFTFEASNLPSGLYVIRVVGESFNATRNVMLLK